MSYKTLQRILDQEINSCTTRVRNSATDALMWLKRGLRFMQKFLIFFKDGERDLTVALSECWFAGSMLFANLSDCYFGGASSVKYIIMLRLNWLLFWRPLILK